MVCFTKRFCRVLTPINLFQKSQGKAIFPGLPIRKYCRRTCLLNVFYRTTSARQQYLNNQFKIYSLYSSFIPIHFAPPVFGIRTKCIDGDIGALFFYPPLTVGTSTTRALSTTRQNSSHSYRTSENPFWRL